MVASQEADIDWKVAGQREMYDKADLQSEGQGFVIPGLLQKDRQPDPGLLALIRRERS